MKRRAEQSDTYAVYFQIKLGVMYVNGEGVAQNYAEALRWFRKAADQGYGAGECNLGVMYQKGWGVPQDYAEAIRWYRKAAEQGEAHCQYYLGVMYEKGPGVKQDYPEALRWYRKAAEHGYADGQYSLGIMYEEGYGVPRDASLGAYWYQKASEQGHELAQSAFLRLAVDGVWPRAPETNDTQSSAKPQPKPKQPQADRKLAVDDLEDLLTGGVTPKRAVTLVQQYGVNFELTDRVRERLRKLGADDALLVAIAKNHR